MISHCSDYVGKSLQCEWCAHDDVRKELALCEGSPPITGGLPSQKGQQCETFMYYLLLALTKLLNKQLSCRWLRRHATHVNVHQLSCSPYTVVADDDFVQASMFPGRICVFTFKLTSPSHYVSHVSICTIISPASVNLFQICDFTCVTIPQSTTTRNAPNDIPLLSNIFITRHINLT